MADNDDVRGVLIHNCFLLGESIHLPGAGIGVQLVHPAFFPDYNLAGHCQ